MTTQPMRPGMKLPSRMDAQFNTRLSTDLTAAAGQYETAVARLATATEVPDHPLLGTMTRDEMEQLHCRHAELHLSFIHPPE